jgi:hypothetical protein
MGRLAGLGGPSSVVRNQDAVDAMLDTQARVLPGIDAFDDQFHGNNHFAAGRQIPRSCPDSGDRQKTCNISRTEPRTVTAAWSNMSSVIERTSWMKTYGVGWS